MFGIGFGEIIIVAIVLIIFVGPEQLPSLMRTLGKALRTMRQASLELRQTIGIDEIITKDLLAQRPLPYKPTKPKQDAAQKDLAKAEQPQAETNGEQTQNAPVPEKNDAVLVQPEEAVDKQVEEKGAHVQTERMEKTADNKEGNEGA
jgi:sec-independent protein translocase protein TatB